MSKAKKQKDLWEEITRKRKELGDLYCEEGTSSDVLAISQELDQLLNQYNEYMKGEKHEL